MWAVIALAMVAGFAAGTLAGMVWAVWMCRSRPSWASDMAWRLYRLRWARDRKTSR